MNTQLKDRNIVVTGGMGALGGAVVDLLLERGAQCWVPSFFPLGDEVPRAGLHLFASVDLGNESAAQAFYQSVPSLWASIHIAGGFAMSSIESTSLDDFEAMWRMNTVSCFLCCREAVKNMRASGAGGRIVNVAARPALEPAGGMIAYTTSKAGVASITSCLAKEVASEGIAVNAIVPSIMDTPANRASMPKAKHETWPKTSEIAQTIAFLVAPENAVSSGVCVPVYGKTL